VADNVFCYTCSGKHESVGIKDYTIILTNLNDIQLNGKCSICGGNVGQYIEYGEVPEINKRTKAFREIYRSRKSIKIFHKPGKGWGKRNH